MSHTVEILSVGTELLLGSIVNLDAQLLSRKLNELGLNVCYHTVVGDNPGRLEEAVRTAKDRADIIVTTGGLGPTCDDLTKQTLAAVFGKELVFHPDIARGLREWFARRGREMTENNLQQARLPEGCTVFPNACGTAPGCAFQSENTHVLMLPGPPGECMDMFEKQAKPYLSALSEGVIVSRTLKIFGIGESAMEALLVDRMNAMTNPTLAPYAKEGECELRITAKGETWEEAAAMIAPVEEELRALLGDVVYGTDVSGLEQVVVELLKERGLTISAAESCTGGLLAKRVTGAAGACAVFRGGAVSCCDEVKAGWLGVPQTLLDEYGAVSAQAARAMAEGCARALNTDLAMATAGVAGPGPDDRGNPAGLVHIALYAKGECFVHTMTLPNASEERVRVTACHHALDLARRYLQGKLSQYGTKM